MEGDADRRRSAPSSAAARSLARLYLCGGGHRAGRVRSVVMQPSTASAPPSLVSCPGSGVTHVSGLNGYRCPRTVPHGAQQKLVAGAKFGHAKTTLRDDSRAKPPKFTFGTSFPIFAAGSKFPIS